MQAEVQEVILKEAIDHLTVSAGEAVDQKENAYRTLITASEITALSQLPVSVPPQMQCPFKAGDRIETYIPQ